MLLAASTCNPTKQGLLVVDEPLHEICLLARHFEAPSLEQLFKAARALDFQAVEFSSGQLEPSCRAGRNSLLLSK
jgi:hypothetical protein